MGLRFAAACLIGAVSVTVGVVPVLAQKKAVPAAKRTSAAKRASAAKAAPAVPLSPEDAFLAKNRKLRGVVQTASGVQYRVIKPATGAHPTDADVALVNYEGKLVNGTSFDKSTQPTPMPVSAVVPGFSEALKLMAKGETLRVWIPSRLAYGAEDQRDDQGKVVIPGKSTLVFDIELIDFQPQS
jgi:FKBP-type peptidyl-prolyl cis-trans isomerase